MNDKKLTVLGIVAIAMVILVGIQSGLLHKRSPAPTGRGYLVQGLNTDAISSIIIGASDDQAILTRTGGYFTVTNNDDYPAKIGAVNEMLSQCLDIKTLELVTSNPANHAEIGVAEDTARYVIKFADSNGQPLAGILISETNQETGNAYARMISSDDVYTIGNIPWIYTADADYIEKVILAIAGPNVESVTVKTISGEYTLIPDGAGGATVADLPPNVDIDAAMAMKVFAALGDFRFSTVRRAKNDKLDFTTTYQCRMADSTVYTISIARRDASFFATVSAEFTDTTQVTMDRGVVETDEQLKAKEAKLLAKEAARDFDQLHSGWVYELPAFVAENMTKHLSDILKEAPVKPTDENSPIKESSDDISQSLSDIESLMQM